MDRTASVPALPFETVLSRFRGGLPLYALISYPRTSEAIIQVPPPRAAASTRDRKK